MKVVSPGERDGDTVRFLPQTCLPCRNADWAPRAAWGFGRSEVTRGGRVSFPGRDQLSESARQRLGEGFFSRLSNCQGPGCVGGTPRGCTEAGAAALEPSRRLQSGRSLGVWRREPPGGGTREARDAEVGPELPLGDGQALAGEGEREWGDPFRWREQPEDRRKR